MKFKLSATKHQRCLLWTHQSTQQSPESVRPWRKEGENKSGEILKNTLPGRRAVSRGTSVAKIAKLRRGFLTKPDLFSPKLLVLSFRSANPFYRFPLAPPTYFHPDRVAIWQDEGEGDSRRGRGSIERTKCSFVGDLRTRGTLLIARFVMQIPSERVHPTSFSSFFLLSSTACRDPVCSCVQDL